MKNPTDPFVQAYIRTALWSSTEYAFGTCPCCGEERLLSHAVDKVSTSPWCAECGHEKISNPPPMDNNYSLSDLAPETIEKMTADCAAFRAQANEIIAQAIETPHGVRCGPDFDEYERAAHDFWLTRCGHGAGFWDGDWPEPMGAQLTAIAKSFGECNLYAGDDGKIYLS